MRRPTVAESMIVYLHGFNSTPHSTKARTLQRHLEQQGRADRFLCPALPHRPAAAMRLVEGVLAGCDRDAVTLVGSSLGGFYATWLAERWSVRAVLLNPAVHPQRDLGAYLGPQRNLYSGEAYELTTGHLDELDALWCARVQPARYLLIAETGDEVLDYREAVLRFRGARQIVVPGGDHTLQCFAAQIPAILAFAGMGSGCSEPL